MRRASKMLNHFAAKNNSGGSTGKYSFFQPKRLVPTKIRFIPGEYKNPVDGSIDACFTHYEHTIKRQNNQFISFPCATRPGMEEAECVACYRMQKGDNTIKRSERMDFTILWLVDFHEVEAQSKNNPEKTVKYKEPCEGRACKLCEQGKEKVFGDKKWYSLGPNHFKNIINQARLIGSKCACGGKVERVAFECASCSELLFKIASSKMKDEEIEEFSRSEARCTKCKVEEVPAEVIECSKCQDPKRLGLFDVEVGIMKEGDKQDTVVRITEWDAKPVDEKLAELAKPWDFENVFKQEPHDVIAKKLGVPNPYLGTSAQTTGYVKAGLYGSNE
jgi:hypothetical protein